LALNTSLDKSALEKALMPYIPLKEQKRIKIIRTIQIILFFVASGIVVLFIVLFSIGNVELLPSIIIMFLGLVFGILLIMALNGSTFDGL
jgi:membrane protein CcdC involved in cytochrome C biogenesis